MVWRTIVGQVVSGHGVASGQAADSPYPTGSIELQLPHFAARGLDLDGCFRGTLNISIAPCTYRLARPRHTFRAVRWIDTIPAEDFSFSPCRVLFDGRRYDGWIYYPHPETKPRHFQAPDIVEVLCPHITGVRDGARVALEVDEREVIVASDG